MSALDNLGPHLLGRQPSAPEAKIGDYPLEAFVSADPLAQAFAALLASPHVAKATKAWAVQVMQVIAPGPTPVPTPTPTPAPVAAKQWPDTEPTLDQGQTPHCIGFGGSQWVNTDPVDDHYTNADGDALYYECKVLDGEPKAEDGSSVHTLAKALGNRGLLTTYAWATTTDAITQWILTNGSVVAGTDWMNDMFNPDADGIIHPTGGVAGGHCYLLDEFLPAGSLLPSGTAAAEDYYGIHNSWSDAWGVKGHAYISVKDFGGLLANSGEALAAVEVA